MIRNLKLALVGINNSIAEKVNILVSNNYENIELVKIFDNEIYGETKSINGLEFFIEKLDVKSFKEPIDVLVFTGDSSLSKEFAPIAASKGILVIDDTGAWKNDSRVPLVVPSVNGAMTSDCLGIIANPSSISINTTRVLGCIESLLEVERVITSAFGTNFGIKDMEELSLHGYSNSEINFIDETSRIFRKTDFQMTATFEKLESNKGFEGEMFQVINIETKKTFELDQLIKNIRIYRDKQLSGEKNTYDDQSSKKIKFDSFEIKRICRDYSRMNGLNLWIQSTSADDSSALNILNLIKYYSSEIH